MHATIIVFCKDVFQEMGEEDEGGEKIWEEEELTMCADIMILK